MHVGGWVGVGARAAVGRDSRIQRRPARSKLQQLCSENVIAASFAEKSTPKTRSCSVAAPASSTQDFETVQRFQTIGPNQFCGSLVPELLIVANRVPRKRAQQFVFTSEDG